jgi:hypothetical protein
VHRNMVSGMPASTSECRNPVHRESAWWGDGMILRPLQPAQALYQQNEPLMAPGTLVTYEVELTSIVDFDKGLLARRVG